MFSKAVVTRLLVLIAISVLTGCGSVSLPPVQSTPPPVEESNGEEQSSIESATPAPEQQTEQRPNAASNSAALVLLAKSETLRTQGKLPQAVALVERAIRLEPSRGDLWIQLGRLRLEEGDLANAEQYARRGIALTPVESEAHENGWLLLADVSEAQGDLEGAAQIRARWLNARG